MTSRNSSPFLIVSALLLGIVLGIALGRGTFLSAQSALPVQARGATPGPRRVPREQREQDALYDQLARQYEQFQPVNRTFELVARTVAPSVVHIVALKPTVTDKKHRSRYEETGSGVIVRRATGGRNSMF